MFDRIVSTPIQDNDGDQLFSMYSKLKANISYPFIRTRMSAMMGETFFSKVSTRKTFGHDIIKLFKNI